MMSVRLTEANLTRDVVDINGTLANVATIAVECTTCSNVLATR